MGGQSRGRVRCGLGSAGLGRARVLLGGCSGLTADSRKPEGLLDNIIVKTVSYHVFFIYIIKIITAPKQAVMSASGGSRTIQ
jgi:hypothetical protein